MCTLSDDYLRGKTVRYGVPGRNQTGPFHRAGGIAAMACPEGSQLAILSDESKDHPEPVVHHFKHHPGKPNLWIQDQGLLAEHKSATPSEPQASSEESISPRLLYFGKLVRACLGPFSRAWIRGLSENRCAQVQVGLVGDEPSLTYEPCSDIQPVICMAAAA